MFSYFYNGNPILDNYLKFKLPPREFQDFRQKRPEPIIINEPQSDLNYSASPFSPKSFFEFENENKNENNFEELEISLQNSPSLLNYPSSPSSPSSPSIKTKKYKKYKIFRKLNK